MNQTLNPLPSLDGCPNGLADKIRNITDTETLLALGAQRKLRAAIGHKVATAAFFLMLALLVVGAVFSSFTFWPALAMFCVLFGALAGASDDENEHLHIQARVVTLNKHFATSQ